eukprot:7641438-Pyramimonas_sp.AAC.1
MIRSTRKSRHSGHGADGKRRGLRAGREARPTCESTFRGLMAWRIHRDPPEPADGKLMIDQDPPETCCLINRDT